VKKAIGVPEAMGSEGSLEVVGRVRDTPFQGRYVDVSRCANLSECWHSVYGVGRTEGGHLPAREG